MKYKILIALLLVGCLSVGFSAQAQISSLWKVVSGVLSPVVSSWGVSMGNATATDFAVSNLVSCDTIDTDASGTFSCGTDASGGGGGGAGLWTTTTDDELMYPVDTNDVVLIGSNATTTTGYIFEVIGDSLFDGVLMVNGTTTDFYAAQFGINSEYFTDLTGTGLQNSSGVLTLNATGDWTGTLDGYEGNDLMTTSSVEHLINASSSVPSLSCALNEILKYGASNTWGCGATTTWDVDGCNDCLNATEIEDIYLVNNANDSTSGKLTISGGAIITASSTVTGDFTVGSTSTQLFIDAGGNITLGTITTGVWQGTAIGDAYLTKSGDWTGTLDGYEGNNLMTTSSVEHLINASSSVPSLSCALNEILKYGAGNTWACGADDTAAGASQNWQFSGASAITPTTSVGVIVTASSTHTGDFTVGSTSTQLFVDAGGNVQLGTITVGTWQGTAIGGAYLTKTGDWTGTLDGYEGNNLMTTSSVEYLINASSSVPSLSCALNEILKYGASNTWGCGATTTWDVDGCNDCLNATEIEDIYLVNNANDSTSGKLTISGGAIITASSTVTGDFTVGSTSTQLFVDAGGNVGIGTASPSEKLTVAGNIVPTADDTYNLGSSSYRWAGLYLGPASLHLGTAGNEAVMGYDTSANYISFDPDGDTTIEFVIDDSGRVGIGTNNPGTAQLKVSVSSASLADNYDNTNKIATSTNITVSGGQLTLSGPCGGLSTVQDDESNTYNTVEIGSQCWFAENIDIGDPVCTIGRDEDGDGNDNTCTLSMSNDSNIEKYCYLNTVANCTTYGGLYQWDEAMQYSTTEGDQGICPSGWHIPTDAEWYTLESYLWTTGACAADRTTWGCEPAGTALKSGGSANFDARLAGTRGAGGSFSNLTSYANLWSSVQSGSSAWRRYLSSGYVTVDRYTRNKANGFSVRCLKD